jgi:O-acetyl-ADP-ribose deacetylase (regulator of RNase III)
MIEVVIGSLVDQATEGVIRPIRSDLAPVTMEGRDLATEAGDLVTARLEEAGDVPVGGAVITPAGDLPEDFVIHVVVSAPEEPETSTSVQRALRNGLRRATDCGLNSLALPPLGMGVGNMDAEDAARVMLELLFNHLDEGEAPLQLIVVAESEYEAEVFGQVLAHLTSIR